MRLSNAFGFMLPVLAALSAPLLAQRIVPDVNTLRTLPGGYGPNTVVALQGYFASADGGGGMLASGSTPNSCQFLAPGSSWASGSTTITVTLFPLPTGIALGMGISGAGIQSGSIVVAFASGSPNTITISLVTTAMGNTAVLAGDNGGTTFKDINNNCFTRLSQTYNQVEWGAKGNNSANDTFSLQNWADALQPHIAVPGNSKITQPLFCDYGGLNTTGIIQGSPTQAVAEDKTILPTFLITADNTNGGFNAVGGIMQAVMIMPPGARCAIHAVGLIADGSGVFNTVNANGKSDLIDDHSYLSGGYNNVDAEGSGDNADLQIYDSSLNNATHDNAYIKTANGKLVRNAFAGAGNDNIYFTNSDIVIADNIIEQGGGWGIEADSGRLMRITGNYFDNNGKNIPLPGAIAIGAIRINNSGSLTICGNSFHRSGGGAEGLPGYATAHIYFSGTDDTVSLCGNVYFPGETLGDNIMGLVRPDYDFDADPATILTNITIADNPAPQNVAPAQGTPQNLGVFSPNAAKLLAASVNPQVPPNFVTGLALSNDLSVATKVNIAAGSAADSTNSTAIAVPTGCSVDLGSSTKGLGALDKGNVQPNTTYYFFVVAGYGGSAAGGSQNCIASTSLTPTFRNVAIAPYQFTLKVNTLMSSLVLFNAGGPANGINTGGPLNPLAGLLIGDEITAPISNIPGCSLGCPKITSLSSYELQTNGDTSPGSNVVQNLVSVANVSFGMSISDGTSSANYIPQSAITGNYVTGVDSPCTPNPPKHCVNIAANATGTATSGIPIYFGGNFTIALDQAATATTGLGSNVSITINGGLYRMVGALYTDSTSSIVKFTQDGDTFYRTIPNPDIGVTILGNSDTAFALQSIPNGIAVEWLGRCVSNAKVIVYSVGPNPGQPVAFPVAPGYDVTSTTQTAEKYQTYTDTSQHIHARANAAPTTFQCMTDGWVWHRGR